MRYASFQTGACFSAQSFFKLDIYLAEESKTGVDKTPVLLNQAGTKNEALFLVGLPICGRWNGASDNARQDDHRHDIRSHQ